MLTGRSETPVYICHISLPDAIAAAVLPKEISSSNVTKRDYHRSTQLVIVMQKERSEWLFTAAWASMFYYSAEHLLGRQHLTVPLETKGGRVIQWWSTQVWFNTNSTAETVKHPQVSTATDCTQSMWFSNYFLEELYFLSLQFKSTHLHMHYVLVNELITQLHEQMASGEG